ncbi:50S ribosomal protein L31 [Campylobacter concisus]
MHPEYVDCTVTCACGNTFKTKSNKSEIRIDICDKCHPFFTGSEKIVDSAGRVEKFRKNTLKNKPCSTLFLLQ